MPCQTVRSFDYSQSGRRKFIRQAAIGGATACLASLPGYLNAAIPGRNQKSLGIALVGLGGYAMGQLAPALQHTKHCHLAGFVTGTPQKKLLYGKQYQIPDSHIYNYSTFDEIAQNPDVDIIYVVLPNAMHAEYTIRSARAGKHVICEKPMALNVAECQQMIDACELAGVHLNIGYRLHFDPFHQVVRHLGKTQSLGAPSYVQADCCQTLVDPNQWRLNKALAGGGAVYDIGIYCLQAARYATNEEPLAVSAQEFKTDPVKFKEVDETVTFQLEFPSGTVANATCSYNSNGHRLYIAYRKNQDFIELNSAFQYSGLSGQLNGRVMNNIQPVNQQAAQMDAISQSIPSGPETTASGAEGIQDMRIIRAIYESLASGGARVDILETV